MLRRFFLLRSIDLSISTCQYSVHGNAQRGANQPTGAEMYDWSKDDEEPIGPDESEVFHAVTTNSTLGRCFVAGKALETESAVAEFHEWLGAYAKQAKVTDFLATLTRQIAQLPDESRIALEWLIDGFAEEYVELNEANEIEHLEKIGGDWE